MTLNKILHRIAFLFVALPSLTGEIPCVLSNDKPILIFDLDGTISNSMEVVFRCYNEIAKKDNLPLLGDPEIEFIRNEGIMKTIKAFNISLFKLPFLISKIFKALNKEKDNIKPFEGMVEFIKSLKSDGYKLGIITSNSKDNLQMFLKKNSLDGDFDFYYSKSSLFGKNKVINGFLKKFNLKPSNVVYIGDETRDIKAAKKCKVKIISVTWGYSSKQLLEKSNPDFLVDNLEQFSKAIEKLQIQTSLIKEDNVNINPDLCTICKRVFIQ